MWKRIVLHDYENHDISKLQVESILYRKGSHSFIVYSKE